MKPSLSIIFFTVSSGAGLGLLALLGLVDLCPDPLLPAAAIGRGVVFGLLLVAAGLASSVLHLARPANAWRAFSRVRTSWLSREAVLAALLFPLAAIYAALLLGNSAGAIRAALAVFVGAIAIAVLFSTAMIYASLKPIRQWHTRWTPANYLLLGAWSGALWLAALASAYAQRPASLIVMATVLGVAALIGKLLYWRHIDDSSSAPTLERAIGVREGVRPPGISVAQARLFDAGHSHRTFLTDEFVFRLGREHARTVRMGVLVCAFALPLGWLVGGAPDWHITIGVAVLCLCGLLAERWLFFAEARHTVRLYHGDART